MKGGGSGCSKGISPLLATVLLIAATVAITTMLSGWVSTTMSTTQTTVGNKTNEGVACAAAEIVIDDVYSGAGSGSIARAIVRNSGGSDNLQITSAQLYDRFGNNFTIVNSLPVNLNKGQMTTLNFNYTILPTTTNDSAHGINNGTLTNGPLWTLAGKRGGALSFDGVNDWVNVPYHSSFNISNNITIGLWIYLAAGKSGTFFKVASSNQDPYPIRIWANDAAFQVFINTNNTATFSHSTVEFTGERWYYLTWTFSAPNVSTFYVNGTFESNKTSETTFLTAYSNIAIGAWPGNNEYNNDTLDDIAIWNRTLTSAEISTGMNVGPTAVSNTNDLVAYWKFDEGKGVLSCPGDFSRVVVTTNCGGVSAEFSKPPKC